MASISSKTTILTIVSIVMCIVAVINIAIGIIFFVIGQAVDDRYKDAQEINATVQTINVVKEKKSSNYEIFVNYDFKGENYKNVKLEGVVNPSSIKEGDSIKILVSASSPTTATMMKFGFIFSIVAGVLGGLGVVFLIIFIVLLVARSKAKKRTYQA